VYGCYSVQFCQKTAAFIWGPAFNRSFTVGLLQSVKNSKPWSNIKDPFIYIYLYSPLRQQTNGDITQKQHNMYTEKKSYKYKNINGIFKKTLKHISTTSV